MNTQHPTTLPSSGQPTWLKKIFQAGFRLAFGGVEVHGMHNVPPGGPLIVASNHRSYLDPVILASFLPRRVYHMAKRELFRNPLFARLITYYGAFPVDREGTARASTFRTALNLLKLNGAVVIFPEGGIVDSTAEVEVKEGVATLAAMSRAPVLPVYIAGSNTLISPEGNPRLLARHSRGRGHPSGARKGPGIPQGVHPKHRRWDIETGGGVFRREEEKARNGGLRYDAWGSISPSFR